MKKWIALMSCCALLMTGMSVYAEAVDTETMETQDIDVVEMVDDHVMAADAPELMQGGLKGTCGDQITWTLDGTAMMGNTLTIQGTGAMYDYNISSKLAPWYEAREAIDHIIVSDGITEIGDAAFYDCKNVTDITMGSDIQTIGANALRRCANVTQIKLPDNLKTVGVAAFVDTAIQYLTLPYGCESLGENALSYMANLAALYVPRTVTNLGNGLFYGSGKFTIYCYTDSTMHQYAEKNHFYYELIDKKLPAVTGITAEAAGVNKVKLTWTAVPDVQQYMIYGKHGGSGTSKYLGKSDTLSWTDAEALDSDYNYYWIYAIGKDYYNQTLYSEKPAYVFAKGVCTPVTNLKAASLTGGVKLTWSPVAGAEGYLVYGIYPDQSYHYVGMTRLGTTFTDKKASKTGWNFYWVYPYHTDAGGKMQPGGTTGYVYGKAR